MQTITTQVKFNDSHSLAELLGIFDENLEVIMRETKATVYVDENVLKISGDKNDVMLAEKVVTKLLDIIRAGERIDKSRIIYCIDLARNGKADDIEKVVSGVIAVSSKGRQIKCKTVGQKVYTDAIKNNTIVFGVGPAGTGKTFLAVALAVNAYKNKLVEKIILTRPAVEAGEKLGFLPGDLQNKVDPYLRPLFDALQEMFGLENYQRLLEKGVIEIAPLAYMRGRTLNDSFIILDEAQNTTKEQMKMFLTRMGEGSKMVITGDITQIDLPEGKQSGLKHAVKILKDIPDIEIVNLSHKDVVRHPLITEIIKAYTKHEENNSFNKKDTHENKKQN